MCHLIIRIMSSNYQLDNVWILYQWYINSIIVCYWIWKVSLFQKKSRKTISVLSKHISSSKYIIFSSCNDLLWNDEKNKMTTNYHLSQIASNNNFWLKCNIVYFVDNKNNWVGTLFRQPSMNKVNSGWLIQFIRIRSMFW